MCPRLPQVSAIRTALVDEAFGDYNEKTMADIATWEETFDWSEIFVERIFIKNFCCIYTVNSMRRIYI